MEMKFKGWQAIIVGVIIVGFILFKLNVQYEALNTQGVEAIKSYLQLELQRNALPKMKEAIKDNKKNKKYIDKTLSDMLTNKFEILNISRRGLKSKTVVKVDISYTGEGEDERLSTRYFKMEYSVVSGWRVLYDSSKFSYYLAGF